MTMISYAQNNEDIMLWRALKHIDNGFYIDVGANDPVEDSVTKIFYDNGWSGINIEPLKQYQSEYLKQRPRDINLECAVSSAPGSMNLWQCDIRGWATLDKTVAENHEKNGNHGYWTEVKIRTLSDIITDSGKEVIHFLKVDVEGSELSVLQGNDWKKFRPWIVLFEETVPNSNEKRFQECEDLLLENNYHFIYADGINRFYIANEKSGLDEYFDYSPNVFDDFIKYREFLLSGKVGFLSEKVDLLLGKNKELTRINNVCENQTEKLALTVSELKKENQFLNQNSHHWWLQSEYHRTELEKIQRNYIWKLVTLPRRLKTFYSGSKTVTELSLNNIKLDCKIFTARLIRKAYILLLRKGHIQKAAVFVNRFPSVKNRLKRVIFPVANTTQIPHSPSLVETQVLNFFKSSMKNKKGE